MKVRKKPVIVEAMLWTGNNLHDIKQFVGKALCINYVDVVTLTGIEKKISGIGIRTLEGDHIARIGDYIIKGVHGEFYPCKPDIFMETYEIVNEDD